MSLCATVETPSIILSVSIVTFLLRLMTVGMEVAGFNFSNGISPTTVAAKECLLLFSVFIVTSRPKGTIELVGAWLTVALASMSCRSFV